jgi:predicted nucleotidyltransferase component of viral defense system
MIRYLELLEKSREFQIPVSTIERDYAQNWILKSLSGIDMVLKGGTGIKKVFIDNYRFSDDLDFTLISNISMENLSKQINKSIKFAKKESGINFSEDDLVLIENPNGFEGSIYFTILNRSRARLRIKIDITGYGCQFLKEKLSTPIQIVLKVGLKCMN